MGIQKRTTLLWMAILALALLCAGAAPAQETSSQQQAPSAQSAQSSQQATPPVEKKPNAGAPPQKSEEEGVAQVTVEKRISPKEAAELLASVDQILKWVSEDTGLPIKHEVKRQLATRDKVMKFLEDRMKEDKDTERLERSSVSLKKFGLLPRDFNLRPFLLELLREQIAGFYDPRTKMVYLLDWVDAEVQKPVLAHELTHALQDQSIGMEKWADVGKDTKNETEMAERDEQRSARQAVLEGQAMVVLLDYSLLPLGKSVADSPQLVDAMKASMTGDASSPMFAKSPIFLREALVFPYTFGLDLVREVFRIKGRKAAYLGLLDVPPTDTRQVMEPTEYLAGHRVAQPAIPDVKKLLGKDFEVYDSGGIGQFDVYVMLKQWISQFAADQRSSSWRGGYYITVQDKKDRNAPVAMMYSSKWKSGGEASKFAKQYAQGLAKRYKLLSVVRELGETGGQWQTEEGAVELELRGDSMVVTESFDPATGALMREAAWKASTPRVAADVH